MGIFGKNSLFGSGCWFMKDFHEKTRRIVNIAVIVFSVLILIFLIAVTTSEPM